MYPKESIIYALESSDSRAGQTFIFDWFFLHSLPQDIETQLYYLQSRYYDPELGRFLNADAFTSTGQGILGNNMFAYCGNNPVNRVDPTGHAFMQMRFDLDGALYMLAPIYWGGARGGGVYGSAGVARSEKTSGTDTTTSNVSNVESDLRENRFSIYKGSAVFSTDLLSGTSAFSFGIIVMGSDNIDHPDFENTLKHEYGHIVHASQIGLTDYFFTTAIPSLMGAALSPHNAWIRENYYNLPWERIAECFGNVNRSHAYGSELAAYLFWIYTLAASAATPW